MSEERAATGVAGPAEAGNTPDRAGDTRDQLGALDGAPPVPDSLDDTGLSDELLGELVLKTLYVRGAETGRGLAEALRIPFHLVDDSIAVLRRRLMVEVLGAQGHGTAAYSFDLTNVGRERARDHLEGNRYVGPAPVPLEAYRKWVVDHRDAGRANRLDRATIERGFGDLVLDSTIIDALGPAINSARSMFLHGAPGNGKTSIAERIARMMAGDVYVPHAVEVDGEIMVLFDPRYHEPLDPEPSRGTEGSEGSGLLHPVPSYDRRFVRIARPTVFVGGELTMDQLDMQYDEYAKIYHAPFQLKAVGGALIIDDFGRQRMRPEELLNRWIVPLEKEIDYLSLKTGVKFSMPFDCLLMFATNLDPSQLVDEAFLRRIHFKIQVVGPDRRQFSQIFNAVCDAAGVPFDSQAVPYIYARYYEPLGIQPRGCHPRDLLGHIEAIAAYEGTPIRLNADYVDRACRSYFLITNQAAMQGVDPEVLHDQ